MQAFDNMVFMTAIEPNMALMTELMAKYRDPSELDAVMTEIDTGKTYDRMNAANIAKALDAAQTTRLSDRLEMLGIPKGELTQSVNLAVSALLEKLDDVTRELARTKDYLAEMERLVDVDCVAPIPNRRAFMRRMTWAIAMFERYEHPSSVLYFDLNDFKEINDTYGHAAGDVAIRHVSQMLAGMMRESDFLARIGGDEFAIIMYYANEESARERGRRFSDKINQTPFVFNGQKIPLSASFGYYAIKKGDDAESSLAAADISMYADKKRIKKTLANIKA